MTTETVYIRPENGKASATLVSYISDNSPELKMIPRPAMIVFPGGGYNMCSDREAEPVALKYFAAGYNTFILRYSLGKDAKFPQPLIEASLAVKYVRENALKFNTNPDKIYVMGFSAGGHLAASLATMWGDKCISDEVTMPYGINRPNGAVLCYAVMAYDGGIHSIFDHITRGLNNGECASREEQLRWSPADHVDENTAPIFIWHTSDDNVVPIANAVIMADHLAENSKQFEMHIYPHGPHGMSLANFETASENPEYINNHVADWVAQSLEWLRSL